jgi:monoamine oxidase
MTIPAGCLQEAIRNDMFTPPLSDAKQEAIAQTKMGCYKKVFLTFDHVFWPQKEAFIGLVRPQSAANDNGNGKTADSDHPLGQCLLFDNLWARDGIPCIEAVLFGNSGNWSIGKSTAEIRHAVLSFMHEAMGLLYDDLDRSCIDCHVTRWEEDRFSRGAYSSQVLGSLPCHAEEMERPEWGGRLVLAGEGTVYEYEGSVHAALFSGKIAAQQVQDCLNLQLSPLLN